MLIRSCPYCGATNAYYMDIDRRMHCGNPLCDAIGPRLPPNHWHRSSDDQAIERWNERHPKGE